MFTTGRFGLQPEKFTFFLPARARGVNRIYLIYRYSRPVYPGRSHRGSPRRPQLRPLFRQRPGR